MHQHHSDSHLPVHIFHTVSPAADHFPTSRVGRRSRHLILRSRTQSVHVSTHDLIRPPYSNGITPRYYYAITPQLIRSPEDLTAIILRPTFHVPCRKESRLAIAIIDTYSLFSSAPHGAKIHDLVTPRPRRPHWPFRPYILHRT